MPIPSTYRLLHSGYTYRETAFDLYGEVDSDGPEVRDVALVGDNRSLVEFIPGAELDRMGDFVAEKMEAARKESLDELRIARAVVDRAG
jgi:hypothetical protein